MKVWLLALLLSNMVRMLYTTLRVTVKREAEMEALCREHGSIILVTWHGNALIPIVRSRGRRYIGLVSLSRDGKLLTECLQQLQWRVIRGSSGRAGVKAAKAALSAMDVSGAILAITPDGPRGPARKVQPGVVYLAQKSGKPIIPVGIAAQSAWRMNSWDKFLVPKPFSKVFWLYGEPIFVGQGEDYDDVCRRIEDCINQLDEEANSLPSLSPTMHRS